jgi:hypothetical protein
MRRALWVIIAAAVLAGVWTVLPSLIVQRQLAAALREGLRPAGRLEVRARTSAPALLRGRVDSVVVSAAGVRVGEMVAEGFTADLRGLRFRRPQGGAPAIAGIEAGTVGLRVTQANLAAYLAQHGVENVSVVIDDSGVTASGNLKMGPVMAPVRLRGQFVAVDAVDLFFRVESLDVGGLVVPGAVVTAMLGAGGQPIISLRQLPVPVVIDRVTSSPGHIGVAAHVQSRP